MRLNDWLPNCDFSEKHRIVINSSPEKIFEAVWTLDMGKSRIITALLKLRDISGRMTVWRKQKKSELRLSIEEMVDKTDFILLEQIRNKEIILGLAGKFWKPSRNIVRDLTAGGYIGFNETGFCKLAWNLYIEESACGPVKLTTETRVLCLGWQAKLFFGLYWAVIRLFSGWIRIEMLRMIKKQAEGENLI